MPIVIDIDTCAPSSPRSKVSCWPVSNTSHCPSAQQGSWAQVGSEAGLGLYIGERDPRGLGEALGPFSAEQRRRPSFRSSLALQVPKESSPMIDQWSPQQSRPCCNSTAKGMEPSCTSPWFPPPTLKHNRLSSGRAATKMTEPGHGQKAATLLFPLISLPRKARPLLYRAASFSGHERDFFLRILGFFTGRR